MASVLCELCSRLKLKITEVDAQLIDRESKKIFKGHTEVIDELTARSRMETKGMMESFPDSAKNLDALNDAGNRDDGCCRDIIAERYINFSF